MTVYVLLSFSALQLEIKLKIIFVSYIALQAVPVSIYFDSLDTSRRCNLNILFCFMQSKICSIADYEYNSDLTWGSSALWLGKFKENTTQKRALPHHTPRSTYDVER